MNFRTRRTVALSSLFVNFFQNLAVASAAVGVFQGENYALVITLVSIAIAVAIVCFTEA